MWSRIANLRTYTFQNSYAEAVQFRYFFLSFARSDWYRNNRLSSNQSGLSLIHSNVLVYDYNFSFLSVAASTF